MTKIEFEKVATTGDLELSELKAMLKTMALDDHLVLHKLEIRQKQNNKWRVVCRASREENASKIQEKETGVIK